MQLHSKNNHLKFSWGNNRPAYNFDEQETHFSQFNVSYGRCSRAPKDFRQECRLAAREINDIADGKTTIYFSGGVDSEIVIRSFLEEKLPFDVVIGRYSNGWLDSDIQQGIEFCKQTNCKFEIVDIDITEFLTKKSFILSEKYKTGVLSSLFWIELLNQTNPSFPVFGAGNIKIEPMLTKGPHLRKDDELFATVMFGFNPLYVWLNENKKNGCPKFNCWSPEQIYSFYLDSYVQDFIKCYSSIKSQVSDLEFIKPLIYNKYWPEMAVREKRTGWEKVFESQIWNQEIFPKWSLPAIKRFNFDYSLIPLDAFENMLRPNS